MEVRSTQIRKRVRENHQFALDDRQESIQVDKLMYLSFRRPFILALSRAKMLDNKDK